MIKCKVCGCEFAPVIDKHYIARDSSESGLSTVIKHIEGNLYDTFDCPACGCQIVVQERKRRLTDISILGGEIDTSEEEADDNE